MARKKDQGGGILVVLALVLAAIAVMGPFIIAGWSLFCELRARRFAHGQKAADLLSAAEREEVAAWERRLAAIEDQVDNIERDGLSRGLAKRADGMFDARATEGRALNLRLEALADVRMQTVLGYQATKDRLANRMAAWMKARSGVIASRAALITFVAVFVVATVNRLDESGGLVTFSTLMFGTGADGAERIGASAAATLCAAVALWIGGSVARSSLS